MEYKRPQYASNNVACRRSNEQFVHDHIELERELKASPKDPLFTKTNQCSAHITADATEEWS